MMQFAAPKGVTLHFSHRAGQGRPVVFLNSLGTDLRIWEEVTALMPDVPLLLMDKRGHGLSDVAPITIPALAGDVADLMDRVGFRDALICGVSVGGLIAQQLAQMRPDLVGGLVLSNTGAKIGDDATWNARIETVKSAGIGSMADGILERWFSARFRGREVAQLAGYRNMLSRTTAAGYVGTCEAIRDADLRAATATLRVPAVCLGGSADLATPPELVAALAALIPGAGLRMVEGVGHLPCIEVPEVVAEEVMKLHKALG